MPELRISDVPVEPASRRRRVEVMWQDGAARRAAVAELADMSDDPDGELIRWYLEDYAEFPEYPVSTIAREAEARLVRVGMELFRRVFAEGDAAGIWERVRDRLGEVRVEVDADPSEGPGLPWELLRDPARDAPVALAAHAFVRTHLRAAGHPGLPEPSGDKLRVLLVICRPGGRDDVPFRSVASRLVRGEAKRMEGLELHVLRPATFARLSQVLNAARDAGKPYHVVHFDGHGTWLDLADIGFAPDGSGGGAVDLSPTVYRVSVVGPVRPGQHGYLLFEDPDSQENQQLVDGPALGRLLVATGVPVLVLNACRSAYTEARSHPGDLAEPGSDGTTIASTMRADGDLTVDVHARIRAYGSLAAEVADVGVPGVVAMRYNVYVVTAAQFMADLYAHLRVGQSLGQAATGARRVLAANPIRQVGSVPVALQDWAVPVVYEAAPLVLLQPQQQAGPLIRLANSDKPVGQDNLTGPGGLPRPPDAGFFGRDETLLALDRAFDTHSVVLLHAFAGAGKSSTAAEFARWYRATGGLENPDQADWGSGHALWSSFEHHMTADRVIDAAGEHFAEVLRANGVQWQAVIDPGQRRDLVMQILAQTPVLWVWDNVEPITGFPAASPSAWTQAEQEDLTAMLHDLAQQTQCKVLLTSRRDERRWLGNLPVRVRLPAMRMRESLQLTSALAARHGRSIVGVDWRPLLRYSAGNPLTITVLVSQALRDNLHTTGIEELVGRLRMGEAELEANEEAELGRTRSLAASLSYGFAQAFSEAERAKLAVLHLFREAADAVALSFMGDPDAAGEDAVPELAGLTPETAADLLDRAAAIGLLTPVVSSYYQIHPALPWYFGALFTATYGEAHTPAAERAVRSYVRVIGGLGQTYPHVAHEASVFFGVLRIQEGNLRHALDRGRAAGMWDAAIGCLQSLKYLYEQTGRRSEWARLVAEVAADYIDLATGESLPGREGQWSFVTHCRARLAEEARDWPAATALQRALTAWDRRQATEALSIPASRLTQEQRTMVRRVAVDLSDLGDILCEQDDPSCLEHYKEALTLDQRIGDRAAEATDAYNLGIAYAAVPNLLNLDQAEQWLQRSLILRPDSDWHGKASVIALLGNVALEKLYDASRNDQSEPVLRGHLEAAFRQYQLALDLTSADDHGTRAALENQLGTVCRYAGDIQHALRRYQQSLKHMEVMQDFHGAGKVRFGIALLYYEDNRIGDALLYARSALSNFRKVGAGAIPEITKAERLIAVLEGERCS